MSIAYTVTMASDFENHLHDAIISSLKEDFSQRKVCGKNVGYFYSQNMLSFFLEAYFAFLCVLCTFLCVFLELFIFI